MQKEMEKIKDQRKVEEKSKGLEKPEKVRQICLAYYSRKDVQRAIFNFSKNRETIPQYFEGFGKRPDSLQYESDIISLAKKGATSFHCSEELWQDPFEISTEMDEEQLNNLRKGWDLVLDIDSKYLDYSKIMAQLLIQALEFHNIKNIGVKFSGSKGFHILVPWRAFPEEINNIQTKNMFPQWPRIISLYLTEMIKKQLVDKITELTGELKKRKYVKDFEAPKKVMPDLILVSSRHLFRAPYSLHEKTALSSAVLDKKQILDILSFEPRDTDPFKIKPKSFLPDAKNNEAKELLLQALDWYKETEKEREAKSKKYSGKDFQAYQKIKIDKSRVVYPPCINNILKGLQDGKKRALFILLNFFSSLNFNQEEIKEKITEWNKKNPKPLKEGYVRSQFSWHFRQKKMMPPNCDKHYYKDIDICDSDNLCRLIKNPVNYAIRKSFIKEKKTKPSRKSKS